MSTSPSGSSRATSAVEEPPTDSQPNPPHLNFPFSSLLFNSAGELDPDELERIVTIMQNPGQFKIPKWFVNRQK
jgi:hypothetical protein